jgi:hypothetical protein
VTEEWIKLHNEELHNSYSSPDVIMMIRLRMNKACSMHKGDKKCTHDLGWKA